MSKLWLLLVRGKVQIAQNFMKNWGWESLSDRRMSRRILQIHKIIDRKTLEYLIDKLPPNGRLFLPTIFRNIKCRTNRYSNSFFPDVITTWNNMITHFEHFPTFANLKKHMLSLIRPEAKLIYGIHDSIGLRFVL